VAFLFWLVPSGDEPPTGIPRARDVARNAPAGDHPPPSRTTNQAGTVNESRLSGNTDRENQTEALNGSYGRVIRRLPRPPYRATADGPWPPASYDKLINDTET
jgi:hypothetical protein